MTYLTRCRVFTANSGSLTSSRGPPRKSTLTQQQKKPTVAKSHAGPTGPARSRVQPKSNTDCCNSPRANCTRYKHDRALCADMVSKQVREKLKLRLRPDRCLPGINQKRQRATQDQLVLLEVEFNQNPTPTAAVRERIAQEINMTERSVQIWFQNGYGKN